MTEPDRTPPVRLRPAPSRLRALLPDLAPWRTSADFRRLWVAGLVTNFGSFLTFVALPVQMKELTGSAVAVGAIGAVELVPLIVFGLYGGALADALDKRKLILWTEAGQGLLSGVLLVNALLPDPAGVAAVRRRRARPPRSSRSQRPALDALIAAHRAARAPAGGGRAQLVAVDGRRGRGSGGGAGSSWRTPGSAGPMPRTSATFAVSVVLAVGLAASPASHEAAKPSLRSILEGARYAWSRKELLGTYAIDLAAMFFAFPLAVLPFLADELDAEWSLGLMYAALPAGVAAGEPDERVDVPGPSARADGGAGGGVLGARDGGRRGRSRRVAGAAVPRRWRALDMVSGIFRAAMWNQTIPDELRGRLAGIELLSYSVGPQLGQVRAGGMAAWIGVRASVWAGRCAVRGRGGAAGAVPPKLMTYDVRTNEHAVRMKEARGKAADGA